MTPQPSWVEHFDLINVIAGSLFMAIIWFMIRTLQSIDKNQKELFERMHTMERDFYQLRGEHTAQHGTNRRQGD